MRVLQLFDAGVVVERRPRVQRRGRKERPVRRARRKVIVARRRYARRARRDRRAERLVVDDAVEPRRAGIIWILAAAVDAAAASGLIRAVWQAGVDQGVRVDAELRRRVVGIRIERRGAPERLNVVAQPVLVRNGEVQVDDVLAVGDEVIERGDAAEPDEASAVAPGHLAEDGRRRAGDVVADRGYALTDRAAARVERFGARLRGEAGAVLIVEIPEGLVVAGERDVV